MIDSLPLIRLCYTLIQNFVDRLSVVIFELFVYRFPRDVNKRTALFWAKWQNV